MIREVVLASPVAIRTGSMSNGHLWAATYIAPRKCITDHHPLIPILNSHRLDDIENPRLQRLAYNFIAEWLKGKENDAPDALSRNPILDPQLQDDPEVW